eukprot:PRCOL_00006399-RA
MRPWDAETDAPQESARFATEAVSARCRKCEEGPPGGRVRRSRGLREGSSSNLWLIWAHLRRGMLSRPGLLLLPAPSLRPPSATTSTCPPRLDCCHSQPSSRQQTRGHAGMSTQPYA